MSPNTTESWPQLRLCGSFSQADRLFIKCDYTWTRRISASRFSLEMRTHYVAQYLKKKKKADGRTPPGANFDFKKWTFIFVIIVSSRQMESKWQCLLHSCPHRHWGKKIRCSLLCGNQVSVVRCNQNRGLKTKAYTPPPPSVRGLITPLPPQPQPWAPQGERRKEGSDLQEQKHPNRTAVPVPHLYAQDQWPPTCCWAPHCSDGILTGGF